MSWRWPWTPFPEQAAVPDLRSGFFDREQDAPTRQLNGDAIYSRIFQRTHKDLVTSGGVAPSPPQLTGFAMDSADDWNTPSLKHAWLQNSSLVPNAQWAWYAAQSFIGYQMCAILSQHWLVDRGCSRPAKDATRVPYEITMADDDKSEPPGMFEYMAKLDKKFKVKAESREFVRKCRIFGIRIAMFIVDGVDYEAPFNPDGVKPGAYKGISQVDPYWITPELDLEAASNTASLHYYEPTWWRINGKRYHRSHLVIIRTNEGPDVLKPTYFFGGVPLPQQVYERVYAAERTANEAPQLALTKRTRTIEGVNLTAAAGNQNGINQRVAEFVAMQDNYGVQVLGGQEQLKQQDISLTDFDQLILTQYQLTAAIFEMPVTKLLGTSPKGMDATGEFEEADYHETLEGINEHDVRPLVERHHLLCMRSYVMPKFQLTAPLETTIVFDKLDAETGKEKAERTKLEAERDKMLAETGAIDGVDVRDRLRKDDESGYTGIEEAMPEGPRPVSVVLPGATKMDPNNPDAAANPQAAAAAGGSGGGFSQ